MTRRRTAAALVAVTALTGGLVFAGTLSASAAPDSITIDQPSGNILDPASPFTLTGEVTNWGAIGGVVTVTVTNSAGTTDYCGGTSYVYFDVAWSCDIDLEYGLNQITASAEADDDPGNPVTASIDLTVGSADAPVITSPTDGASSTLATTTFTGTGPHLGTVTVQARPDGSGDPFVDVCPAPDVVGADGAWSCDATFPAHDLYEVRAVSTLLGGGAGSISATRLFTYLEPTNIAITAPADGAEQDLGDPDILITGTTDSEDPVTVWRMPQNGGSPDPVCNVVPVEGEFGCLMGFPAPDRYTIEAVQGGSSASIEYLVYGDAPVPDADPLLVPDPGGIAQFTGTTSWLWGSVTVDFRDLPLGCVDTDVSAGVFDCPVDMTGYLGGTYTVDITQDDLTIPFRSHTMEVTYQAVGGLLEITSPAHGGTVTYDAAPNFLVVSGTTEHITPAPVRLYVDESTTPSCEVVPQPDGTWTCPGFSLPAGPYELWAYQDGPGYVGIDIEVLMPAPNAYGFPPYEIEPGDDFVFGGQQMYPDAWTRATIYHNAGGTPGGIALGPVDCSPPAVGFWTCEIPNTLGTGMFFVEFVHYIPGEPDIHGAVSGPHGLNALPGTEPPALDCTFGPGRFSVSPDYPLDYIRIGRLDLLGSSMDAGDLGLAGECDGVFGGDPPGGTWDFVQLVDCPAGCTLNNLTPGYYEVYHRSPDGSGPPQVSIDAHSYVFRVPDVPTISSVSSTATDVVLSGTAESGIRVRVRDGDGSQLCATTATSGGAWSCQFPKSAATTARAYALDSASPGMSPYSAAREIPVATAPLQLRIWKLEFDGEFGDLRPGSPFSINLTEMPEGTEIEVWMHSTPRLLGSAVATGEPMKLDLMVPEDIEEGAHTIEVIATTPDHEVYEFSTEVTVLPSDSVPVVDPDGSGSEEEPVEEEPVDEGSGGFHGSRADGGAPSILTQSLATLSRIVENPIAVVVAGALALALLLLVGLPAELLNQSISSNSNRLGRAYAALDRAATRAQDWFIRVTRSRALAAGILVTVIAVVYGFVDPNFGFDLVSLRLVLSLGLAFFLLTYGVSWVTGALMRRRWGVEYVVELKPSIVLFAVLGVVVSRILDFAPGFFIGVAIGLELLSAAKRVAARAVLTQLALITVLSLAAWIAYSVFAPSDDFLGTLTHDTFVAITAEGLTGALIAAFPLRFLDGRTLWEDSKPVWTVTFLVVATAFVLLVLPTASQDADPAHYGVWVAVFAGFGVLAVLVWLLFARADKKAERAERAEVDA